MTDSGTDPTISDTSFPFLKNKVDGIDLIWNSAEESGLESVSTEKNLGSFGYTVINCCKFFCMFLQGPHHELQGKKNQIH